MFKIFKTLFITAFFVLVSIAFVQAKEVAKETKNCLWLHQIKNIEVVDNQTVLFHMNNKDVWQSKSPVPCVSLKMEGGITYTTSINQLCDLDIIKVINTGIPCPLGKFEKIIVDETKDKKAKE